MSEPHNTKDVAARLMAAIKKAGLSYGELATMTKIPKSAIQRYATGETEKIPLNRIRALASALNTSASIILGWTGDEHRPTIPGIPSHPDILPISTRNIPLVGTIACGEPIYAEEDYSAVLAVGADVDCDFALRCSGDSMIGARIFDGDIVFIKKQPIVLDGEIAAVMLDDDATLKRVYHLADGRIELRAENPMYKSIIVGGEDETRDFHILGKAVAFQSKVI